MSDSPYCNCLYYSANALGRIMTNIADEEFKPTGLSPSYALLLLLVINNRGISPGEISDRMQLTPSTITRLLDKLERRAYLERRNDGRSVTVFTTKEGKKMKSKIEKCWKQLYNRYTSLLGENLSRNLTENTYQASKILEAS